MDLILQRVLSCSKAFLGLYPPSKHSTCQVTERIPSISLPEPPSLQFALLNVGAPIALAEEMQRAYQRRADDLKERYETAASQVALALLQYPDPSTSPSLQTKLFATFKELYTRRLEEWQRDCLSLYKRRATVSTSQGDGSQRGRGTHATFNIEYVPLLEHFFEENPFPAHAEKASLAKQSGMTYRQIHVWFQNKRTRSRKERRKTILNRAAFPANSLCDGSRETRQCMKRNDDCTGRPLLQDEVVASSHVQDPLDIPAPPHAFPSTYPPPPQYDPFPGNNTLQSGMLPWRRRPSSALLSLTATSVSDLIEAFSQLSVKDDHGHQCRQLRSVHTPEIGAAVASITVKPFSAPLFATCRPVAFITNAVSAPLPTVPAPRTHLHPFPTPSLQAQPVTLMHPSIQKTSNNGRKVASLPRRVPQVSTQSKQNLVRSTPDYSSYRSLSSGSSVRSSSPELNLLIATTPEVGSPFPLSLSDDVSPVQESRPPTGHGASSGLAANFLSAELRLTPSSTPNPTPNTISEISVPQTTSSFVMRAMRRAVPPPHTRLPLCVGS